jgi:signal transduction histidine kinase
MRNLSVIICFISLIMIYGPSFAQTHAIDSLKNKIWVAPNENDKLKAIFALCDQRQSLNTDTFYYYAKIARQLSGKRLPASDTALADYLLSTYQIKKGNIDSAMSITEKYLKHLSYANNKNVYVKFMLQKGQIYIKSDKYKDALTTFYQLLSEAEQQNDPLMQMRSKNCIGWVNMEMDQNREALNWFYKALDLNPATAEESDYAVIYSNMSATYNELNHNDSAEFYINKAIALNRKSGSNLQFLANALAIQADIFIDTKRTAQAEAALNEVVQVRKQIGEPFYIVSDMSQLAIFYAHNNQPEKGIQLCTEGIAMAKQYGLSSKLQILYDALADNYKAAGDLANYSTTLEKIIALKDSMYKKNSADALAEIQGKYDLQKKENIIVNQELSLVKKNYLFYGSLVLLFFAVIVSLLIFNNYRRKQRMKMQLMLETEKLAAGKAVEEAEEKERKRIAADLHDNLGAYAASIAANLDHISPVQMDKESEDALLELRSNSQSIVSQLSDTIWALKKDALLLTAISDRIKIFIQKIQLSYTDIKFDVVEDISIDYLLPPSQAFHLFQVMKEAIINALKHSYCHHVIIEISGKLHWSVIIKDDGKGFEENGKMKEGGNGLANMKARSKDAGWQIDWQVNEPQGTRVVIESTTN